MRINGQEKKLENPITLARFLEREGYEEKRVAVEKNGRIVPKSEFQSTELSDADTLEIVRFVGGG